MRKAVIIITFLCVFSVICVHPEVLSSTNRLFTTYDGVTSDKYISFLQLDGTNSASLPIADSVSLSTSMPYTIMMWFKPTSLYWSGSLSQAFQISGSFQCYFGSTLILTCESAGQTSKLQVDASPLNTNQWTHIAVSGSTISGSYLQVETNQGVLAADVKSYIPIQQAAWGWRVCLGICSQAQGLIGGIREFKFLQQYVSQAQITRVKNFYLSWDLNILGYYRFSSSRFLNDEFRGQSVTLSYGNSSGMQGSDMRSNDVCFPFLKYDSFLQIAQDSLINPITVDKRWIPSQTNYGYTMSVWLRQDGTGCFQSNPTSAISSCNIVMVNGVFMLFKVSANQARFAFFALQSYYWTTSNVFLIPINQWINIQMTMSQYGGFEVRTYDILGRKIENQLVSSKNMQQQLPTGQISLLKHFRGYTRQFTFYTSRKSLPLDISQETQSIKDANLILLVKFQSPYFTLKSLQNYALNAGYSLLTLSTSALPTFSWVEWDNFALGGSASIGLVTYSQDLFDGIACNDGYLTLSLTGANSYVKDTVSTVTTWLQTATVEFWVKPQDPIGNSSQLFSIWAQTTSSEFFSIYVDSNDQLNCAPFGTTSTKSPQVTILDFTEANREQFGWFHLACQYTYVKNITAYLHVHQEKTYNYSQSLMGMPSYIPADSFDIYMGNSYQMNQGAGNILMKEVRLWAVPRTYSDIEFWMYSKIQGQQYSSTQLLSYVRMQEASYQEFDIEDQQTTTYNNISYVGDSSLVICPQQTYHVAGKCYQDPINQLITTVFPYYNSTSSSLSWKISAQQTELIDTSYWDSLLIGWSVNDTILMSVARSQFSKRELLIPSLAFKDNTIYPLSLNITNSGITFNQKTTLNFIPVSCHWYVVTGGDAYSTYTTYLQAVASQDVTFQLSLFERYSYCSSTTYYNQLVQSISYVISPSPSSTPNITFNFRSDNKTIDVTIPAAEQSKFTVMTDYQIILSIYWTSNLYSNLIISDKYTFQNVMYTINFHSNGGSVNPSLSKNIDFVLKGQTLELDASDSKLTGATDSSQQTDLSFSWICPSPLQSLCANQTGTKLSVSFDSFVNSNGSFGQSYTFQVNVTWRMPTGVSSSFYASQSASWYNVIDPKFSLTSPSTISATHDYNTFSLAFDNYSQNNIATVLSISWSVSPAVLDAASQNLTNNSCIFTIAASQLSPATEYTLYAAVQSIQYPAVSFTQNVTFTTPAAPSGGSAYITPDSGFINVTTFSIGISGWSSQNEPVTYGIWNTTSPDGSTPDSLLTSSEVASDETYSFTASNSFPYLVQITDSIGEVAWAMVAASVTVSTTEETSVQSLLANLDLIQSQTPLKYAYMNTIVNLLQTNGSLDSQTSGNTTEDAHRNELIPNATYVNQQMTYREQIVDSISTDVQNITSAQSSNQQLIVSNSVSLISQILSNTNYVSDSIVQKSLNISKTLVNQDAAFNKLVVSSPVFTTQFTNTLSNIFDYATSRLYSVLSTLRKLQASSDSVSTLTIVGIQDLSEQTVYLKNKFMSQLCGDLVVYETPQIQSSTTLDLVVEKIQISSSTKTIQFINPKDKASGITIDVQDLIREINAVPTLNPSSICAQTTFYHVNPSPIDPAENKTLTQHSSVIIEQTFSDQTGQKSLQYTIDQREFTSMYFSINPITYKNNQTVCMAYSNTFQEWSALSCQTVLNNVSYQLECQCTMTDNQYYGIFTDTSRVLATKVYIPPTVTSPNTPSTTKTTPNTVGSANVDQPERALIAKHTHSYSFIGVILLMIVIGIGVPVSIYILDRKDYKHATSKLESQSKQVFLENVAHLSQQPKALWRFKQDQAFGYSMTSRTLFSHYIAQIHPLLSLFTKYDVQESRLLRFTLYFAQLSLYTLICVTAFHKGYRKSAQLRNENGLDETDAGNIMIVGLIGMVLLLPIPRVNLLFKSKIIYDKPEQSNQHQQCNHNSNSVNFDNIDNTQEQNIMERDPPSAANKYKINRYSQNDVVNQEVTFVQQRIQFQYALLAFGYILWIISFAVVIAFAYSGSVYNSYCVVAAYYFGFFGSAFCSNMLRIGLNVWLAPKVANNESSLLRIIVAKEAVQIIKDINLVRRAERLQKELQDENQAPLQKQYREKQDPRQEAQKDQINVPIDSSNNEQRGPRRKQKRSAVKERQISASNDSAISLDEVPVDVQRNSTHKEYFSANKDDRYDSVVDSMTQYRMPENSGEMPLSKTSIILSKNLETSVVKELRNRDDQQR